MVTAEAMACGTPVTAYNNTANPELIGVKEGILAEDGNVLSLFKSIELIRKNGKLFFSVQCRKKALTHFDKNINFQSYVKLYDRLLVHK